MSENRMFQAMEDQAEIHRMATSEDVEERKRAIDKIREKIAFLPDDEKKQAWGDLHNLTSDTDSGIRCDTADALGRVFAFVPDKIQAWNDLHKLNSDIFSDVRLRAANALGRVFAFVPDKIQAWDDLHRLTSDTYCHVRWGAAVALEKAFAFVPDKMQSWDDLHRLTSDTITYVRHQAADSIGSTFSYVPDKEQAWEDLHKLTSDTNSDVRRGVVGAIGNAFSYVPDKKQAWEDLHKLTSDTDSGVRGGAADSIGSTFSQFLDKKLAWDDLHRLTSDAYGDVRKDAASALGSAFSHLPDKEQAWADLHRLTSDHDRTVRIAANHSSGRISIFRASEADEDGFKREMEKSLGFFEKASKESKYDFDNPAKFCLPFYRSFYTLTFKKEKTEAEVQKYLLEAKSAVYGSESKEKLLEAVENLGNALKEVQMARDFDDIRADLNAYRRYCDRACELLGITEEKAPGASRLIRKGLPIIDERIKGIIAEIQEKAKALCKQVKDTEFKEIGQQVNNVGQELSKVIDPIRLEKEVSRLLIPISAMCKKMPEEDRGEACEILKQINDEQYVEDKLSLISMFLSKISTQMDQKNIYVSIEKSNDVQLSIGNGNYQVHSSNPQQEKD